MSAYVHYNCDAQIAILKSECATWRIKYRELERELEMAKASAATANGIAAQVFAAIKMAASGQRDAGAARVESAVT